MPGPVELLGTPLAPLGFKLQAKFDLQRPSKKATWDSATAAALGRLGMQRPGTCDYKPWLACMLQMNLQHLAQGGSKCRKYVAV